MDFFPCKWLIFCLQLNFSLLNSFQYKPEKTGQHWNKLPTVCPLVNMQDVALFQCYQNLWIKRSIGTCPLVLCLQFVLVAHIKLMNQKIVTCPLTWLQGKKCTKILLLVHVLSKYSLFHNFTLLLWVPIICIQFFGSNILHFSSCHWIYWKQLLFYEVIQCRFLPPFLYW